MAKGVSKFRPTGRRGNFNKNRRVFAKSKNRSMAVYATSSQASRIPRNHFSFLPNQFRIRLKADWTSNSVLAEGQTTFRTYYPLSSPVISLAGGATVRAAGGLLPLLYLYQRVYVMKANIKLSVENMTVPTTEGDVANPRQQMLITTLRAVTSIMTDKQASDLVATGAITFDELRTTPGAKNYFAQPFPATTYSFTDVQSVDVLKYIGGGSMDHTQSSYAVEGVDTFTLTRPNAASRQNLPAYFFMLERAPGQLVNYRVTLEITYDCEFSNVRPLEQTPGALFPWSAI